MKTLFKIALLAQLVIGVSTIPCKAANEADAELRQAATELAQQYDARYASRDSAGMAGLYAADGRLVSPEGPTLHGRVALTAYYSKRFASGFRGYVTKVLEVHAQGTGGYSISEFAVSTPITNGQTHQVHGTVVSIYQHDTDGLHFSLVVHSVLGIRRGDMVGQM
ncbi:MAG: nuclear transport factor 2 family protein [Verrucomicrobia bacterium]|nr:nuclear transport factor 2 family protein [Verrucomicrobiota bacterium]